MSQDVSEYPGVGLYMSNCIILLVDEGIVPKSQDISTFQWAIWDQSDNLVVSEQKSMTIPSP
jgi:hypothetical protein